MSNARDFAWSEESEARTRRHAVASRRRADSSSQQLHPLDDSFDNDEADDEGISPPYRQQAMSRSQLTLPPQYVEENETAATGGGGNSQISRERGGDIDAKRDPGSPSSSPPQASRPPQPARIQTGRMDTPPLLRVQGVESPLADRTHAKNDSNSSNETPLRKTTNALAGDTLVAGSKPRTVQYPDEHGGVLHARPSPSYPEPRWPGAERPHMMRGFSTASTKSDDDSDVDDETYDWSTEEDLLDEEAKFEKKLNQGPQEKKRWGIKRLATFFVSTLVGTTILTVLLVAVPILLHFFYYKPHPDDHRRYITDNVSAWLYWLASNLFISWYLAVFVDILPHLVTWIVNAVWGQITESFKTKVTLYEAFKGWIKPMFYAGSGWASWTIIFQGIFNLYDSRDDVQSRAPYTDRLRQVVEFLFFLILVISVGKVFMQIIAFTFHRTAYKERIEEVNKGLAVLDHLKDYRPKRRHAGQRSSVAMTPNTSFGALSALGRKTPPFRSRPATPEPAVLEDGFAGDIEDHTPSEAYGKSAKRKSWLSGFGKSKPQTPIDTPPESMPMSPSMRGHGGGGNFGNMSPASSGTPSRNQSRDFDGILGGHRSGHAYPPGAGSADTHSDDGANLAAAARALKTAVLHDARNIKGKDQTELEVSFAITSPSEAKKLARQLYYAFRADRRRTYLIPSDFYPAYTKPEDAKDAFKIFDKDGNENITRAEIKTKIVKIYKERRFLARSLRDVSSAIGTLDGIVLFFALVIVFFISLSVFNVDVGKSLTSVYTLGIAASFVFRNAASQAFDAIVFLFVTHPYDTGDRCFIDNENLVVKKMGLFATTFVRADGTQTYYFNSQLFSKFITNARRSPNMGENLTMQINWRTPLEKIDALESSLNKYMEHDDNRWFQGPTAVVLQHIDYQRSLELTIYVPHNANWQDWGGYLMRKTAFHAATNYFCNQLGITWSNSPQPVLTTEGDPNQPYEPPNEEYRGGDDEEDAHDEDTARNNNTGSNAPTTTLFFKPPTDDNRSGLRNRKSRKRAVGGVIG